MEAQCWLPYWGCPQQCPLNQVEVVGPAAVAGLLQCSDAVVLLTAIPSLHLGDWHHTPSGSLAAVILGAPLQFGASWNCSPDRRQHLEEALDYPVPNGPAPGLYPRSDLLPWENRSWRLVAGSAPTSQCRGSPPSHNDKG